MKRELSQFFAKELLPAYIEDILDKERRAALESLIAKDDKIRANLKSLKLQVEFLEKLSEIKPSPELVKFLETRPSGIHRLKEKYAWAKWPSTAQWTLQLACVGLLLLVTVHFFPWLNLARSVKKIKPVVPQLSAVDVNPEPIKVRPVYGPLWPKDFPTPEIYAKQMEEKNKKNAAIADIVAKTDEDNGGAPSEQDGEDVVVREGFVWRGALKVPELDEETSDKVTKEIESLGGAKAGQVELGWKKGNTRYYHFTLPIANYTQFQEKMSEVGTMTLTKERHPRVMKNDVMRIIMSVEVGN